MAVLTETEWKCVPSIPILHSCLHRYFPNVGNNSYKLIYIEVSFTKTYLQCGNWSATSFIRKGSIYHQTQYNPPSRSRLYKHHSSMLQYRSRKDAQTCSHCTDSHFSYLSGCTSWEEWFAEWTQWRLTMHQVTGGAHQCFQETRDHHREPDNNDRWSAHNLWHWATIPPSLQYDVLHISSDISRKHHRLPVSRRSQCMLHTSQQRRLLANENSYSYALWKWSTWNHPNTTSRAGNTTECDSRTIVPAYWHWSERVLLEPTYFLQWSVQLRRDTSELQHSSELLLKGVVPYIQHYRLWEVLVRSSLNETIIQHLMPIQTVKGRLEVQVINMTTYIPRLACPYNNISEYCDLHTHIQYMTRKTQLFPRNCGCTTQASADSCAVRHGLSIGRPRIFRASGHESSADLGWK